MELTGNERGIYRELRDVEEFVASKNRAKFVLVRAVRSEVLSSSTLPFPGHPRPCAVGAMVESYWIDEPSKASVAFMC